jgi:hypothetical protein
MERQFVDPLSEPAVLRDDIDPETFQDNGPRFPA